MLKSDLNDLNRLHDCEVVRFVLNGDMLHLLVVADNEEGQAKDNQNDEESCDCCDGLNGHLFMLTFHGVKDFVQDGKECDNYQTMLIVSSPNQVEINLKGMNFDDEGNNVKLTFGYESFDVSDKGVIEGPSA